MSKEDSFISTLAIREQYRDEYWRKRDPIADDRLLWRAQTFRHTVHLLPGQTILELGCGELRLTRALLRVSRGENPITAVTFQNSLPAASDLNGRVEVLRMSELPGRAREASLRLHRCDGSFGSQQFIRIARHCA